jgi:hypothetical protein
LLIVSNRITEVVTKKFDPAGCFPDCLGNSLI